MAIRTALATDANRTNSIARKPMQYHDLISALLLTGVFVIERDGKCWKGAT